MKERNGQLRYLSIVIGAFLSVGVIVGLTNNLYSLYVIPITTGLGISRGLYSMGITVRYIASAFCNLFMGRLYQRFGYRRPTVLLVLLVAASYVGYGTARNAVPLFLGALIYGVGEYFISTAALSRMLGNWFQSHLGVVTGIVMAASGVGGSALSLVLSGIGIGRLARVAAVCGGAARGRGGHDLLCHEGPAGGAWPAALSRPRAPRRGA